MKALLLLAATSLSAIAVLPHMPDMTTLKSEVNTLAAAVPNPLPQISKLIAPAQPDQADPAAPTPQPDPSTQAADSSTDPSATPAPFVAKASPEDVQRSYGQPERVERTMYGETWYYPVYVFYFRNGYVQRTQRSTGSITRGPFVSNGTSLALHNQPEPWRFSNHTSLNSASLNGGGVQRTSTFVPRQTTSGVASTGSSAIRPTYNGSSTGLGGSSSCNRSTQSTTNYHPPVVQRAAPVQHTAPVVTTGYGRVGY